MCLGIPGRVVQVVQALEGGARLARVDVSGVTRTVDAGLLEDEHLVPGDWVLVHGGFALSKVDEEEAARARASLRLLGRPCGDDLASVWSSQVDLASGA